MFVSSFFFFFFKVMSVTIREDGKKNAIVHILKTHQREGTWGTKQKWVTHREHISPDQTACWVTKVEWPSVLSLSPVRHPPWARGHGPEVFTARTSRSPPCSLCPPGTTWTSLSHLSLPWPPRSWGWPSTDTKRALCTPTSTMFSPRSDGHHKDLFS